MEVTAAKKAEFARLFDLFQRLTNRVSRKSYTPVPPENTRTFVVPADLALPAIRNLSNIESCKKGQQLDAKEVAFTERPRSNAMAVTTEDAVSKEGKESVDKFPIGKSYPFTFKMMLHKLYELEEWAKKVKGVLEKSREDYKPLSEVNWEKKRTAVDESWPGCAQIRSKQQEGRIRSDPVPGGQSPVAHTQSSYISGDVPVERAHHIVVQAASRVHGDEKIVGDDARAIKKRCVGRNKLMTGNLGAEDCKPERAWVYNSAVALMEVDNMELRGGNLHATKSSSVTFQSNGDRQQLEDSRRLLPGAPSMVSPTSAQRKRALSEADTTNSHLLSRKRPYLLG